MRILDVTYRMSMTDSDFTLDRILTRRRVIDRDELLSEWGHCDILDVRLGLGKISYQ